MTLPQRVETAPGEPAPQAVRDQVLNILEAGQVAALPTETVYGLAVRADDPAALERLCRLKGRDDPAGLTWHAGSAAALQAFDGLPNMLARLGERHWPGPLTLVLRGVPRGLEHVARAAWTGVRVPAHPALQSLLDDAPFPIVMTSANRAGQTPAVDAASVEAIFGEELALLLDTGPARIGESSTVLQIGPGRFRVLREGLLNASDLKRTAGLALGFVCTGNTCRSPMAETLAHAVLARRLATEPGGDAHPDADSPETFGFSTGSAGVFAGTGSTAADHAIETLRARGLDLSRHSSRPAAPELVRDWDRVYCLTRSHLDALIDSLPPARAKNLELLDPEGQDIPDPIGASLNEYQRCADRIEQCLERRADEWL
ncbi:MAG: L-threonylcarbamoyladenylate synthase [Chlamydiales bacterium]|jgi:L-threonylcarbamoyladenylate synthase